MAVVLELTERGEVRVETGTGLVDKIEHKDGDRNARVVFQATHVALREPVAGWLDTNDAAAWDLVRQALEKRVELEYRIEVHRKGTVALAKPIAELGNREKVRDLKVVTRKGQMPPADQVPPTDGAVRPPSTPVADETPDPADADPEAGWLADAQREATEQRQELLGKPAEAGPAGAVTPGNYCPLCNVRTDTARELVAHARGAEHQAKAGEASATFDPGANPRERSVPAPSNRGGGKVKEGKPWELENSDGSLNLDSYSYRAAVDFLEYAHYLVTHRIADAGAEGLTVEFKLGQVEGLAKTLLAAADAVQAATREDGHVDRLDGSHYRARGAVRTALKVYPVPWGVDAETRQAWLAEVVAHASALLRIAFDIFQAHERPGWGNR